MYANILVPVDLAHGDADLPAVTTAAELARVSGGCLNLLSVVPDYGSALVASFFPADHEARSLAAANDALHRFAAAHVPEGVAVRHVVGHGTPYREILRVAGEVAADLIVMSAHRPAASDYLIGPNAARVARHAETSVLIVRAAPARG